MFRFPPRLYSFFKKAITKSLIVLTLISYTYAMSNFSQLHRFFLRKNVGSNVIKIVTLDSNYNIAGGGTGFVINSPHGKQYILTNAHVCEAFKEQKINAEIAEGVLVPLRIIQVSDTTDLCLTDAPNGYEGIDLASDVEPGEQIASVGYPKLQPLTVMYGEMIGNETAVMFDGVIGITKDESDCNKPKNNIIEVDSLFGRLRICTVKIRSQKTTIVILGGNSGSPVVNFWGNVVGVVFGADRDSNWGSMISLEDIRAFLAPY